LLQTPKGSGGGWGSTLTNAPEPEIPNRLPFDAEKNLPEQPSRLSAAEPNQRSFSLLLEEREAQATSFSKLRSESNLVVTKSNDDFFRGQSEKDAIEIEQNTAIASIHRSSCRRWEWVDNTCEENFRKQTSYQNLEQTECGMHKDSFGQGREHVTLNPSIDIENGHTTCALDNNENIQPIRILRRIKPNDDVLREKEFYKLSNEESQKVLSSNIHDTLPDAHADALSTALQSLDINTKSATNVSRGIASALEQQEIVLRHVILTRKKNTTKRSETSGACYHEKSKNSGKGKEKKSKEQVTRMDNKGKRRHKPRERDPSISILSSNECSSRIVALLDEENSSSKKQALTAVIEAEDVNVKGRSFSTINEAGSPSSFSINSHQLDSAWKSNPTASFVNANKTLLGSNHFSMPDWSPNVAIFSFQVDNIWSSCVTENHEPLLLTEFSEKDVTIQSRNVIVTPDLLSSASLVDSKVQEERIDSNPIAISNNKKTKNNRKALRKKKESS